MKKIVVFLIISILVFSTLAGCGNSENVSPTDAPSSTPNVEPSPTETPTPTPEPHSHSYTESTSKEATCVEAGEKTFTCECGDAYTEQIEATGHNYEIVTGSEAAATCTTDGKKADKVCDCGEKDTVADKGSKLEKSKYTYTDMNKTMYAKQSVNVRDLPSTDGNKLGGLSSGQAVTVTGKCNETGWYRIDYNGSVAYVSNSYLVDNKLAEPKPEEPSKPAECPYPLYQVEDNWTSISWYYINGDPNAESVFITQRKVLAERHGVSSLGISTEWTGYFVNGAEVAKFTYYVK